MVNKGTEGHKKSIEFIKVENRALKVLYDMHKYIDRGEVFTDKMRKEGIDVISALLRLPKVSEIEDNYIRFYIDLIYLQLKCNDLMIEEEEYEKLKEAYYDAERKLKIFMQREIPDQQTTLGHA